MRLLQENFREAYDSLRACGSRGRSVLLLAAPDCDALCAARLLTTLLKADAVAVRLVPVAGYTGVIAEVKAAAAAAGEGGAGVGAVLLINCGAVIKMSQMLELDGLGPDVPFFVLDSHRPFYHSNLRDPSRVRVFAGLSAEDAPLDELPEDGDSELEVRARGARAAEPAPRARAASHARLPPLPS